jgi:hypothetical protein
MASNWSELIARLSSLSATVLSPVDDWVIDASILEELNFVVWGAGEIENF